MTQTIARFKTLIEERLDQLIPQQDTPCTQLYAAARYALLGGGKRLRPLLVLATTEALGTPPEKALDAACAIEMVHAYSLIHDDLPCMDDDDYRRGKPTLHRAFDEGHAVLTGDYLLTRAFEVVATDSGLSPDQKIALISLLAKKSGGEGMIGGQILDIEAEGVAVSPERLSQIHAMKTGALISASIESGCIIAKSSQEHTEQLIHYGSEIGLAFQIIDDVIDVRESHQKHGKHVPSDAANNKTTYVTIYGIDTAELQAEQLLKQALARLDSLPYNTSMLYELANALVLRSF